MLRKTLGASRLQEEVSRRLHRLQEVIDDGVKFTVPRPQRQNADRSGCNWTMQHFGNSAGFEAVIAEVLARVQAEYDLAADDDADAQAIDDSSTRSGDVNPFGEKLASAKAANPFGDAKPVKSGDPFGGSSGASSGSDDSPARGPKRPANPFSDD